MSDEDASNEGSSAGGRSAQDVPLVRTEGKQYQSGFVWSVEEMLEAPELLRDHRDRTEREAEEAFGLEISPYFYVGHACADFARDGNAVVFLFTADTFDDADDEGQRDRRVEAILQDAVNLLKSMSESALLVRRSGCQTTYLRRTEKGTWGETYQKAGSGASKD
ncbi:MAG: hypothetical protein ABI193_16745, partial [Minicystis sp.]